MNCEKIKELILTDFSDGQLDEKTKWQVNQHLDSCANCRDFYISVNKIAIEPFKNAATETPPEYLWHRIKDRITSERPEPATDGLLEKLQVFFHPKPAFALATIAVVVIIASVVFRPYYVKRNEVNLYLNEQMEFISHLGHNGNHEISFGTDIEEFFL